MRISELSRRTDLTVATIKYYIREGLLHPGIVVSATQAEYDESHAERLRLVRALVEVGGLSITTARELLATLDAPAGVTATRTGDDSRLADPVARAVQRAHEALSPRPPQVSLAPRRPAPPPPPERALAVLAELGWPVEPGATTVRQLEIALDGVDAVGLVPGPGLLQAYAAAALSVAEAEADDVADLADVADDNLAVAKAGAAAGSGPGVEQAARQALLGTVMYEPVLVALRRLAQQQVFLSRPRR